MEITLGGKTYSHVELEQLVAAGTIEKSQADAAIQAAQAQIQEIAKNAIAEIAGVGMAAAEVVGTGTPAIPAADAPKRRGRPPGSKNRPKTPGAAVIKTPKAPKVVKEAKPWNVIEYAEDGAPIGRGGIPTNKMDKKSFAAMLWHHRAQLGWTEGLKLNDEGRAAYAKLNPELATKRKLKHLSSLQARVAKMNKMKDGEAKTTLAAKIAVAVAFHEKLLRLAEKFHPPGVYEGSSKGHGETNTVKARAKAAREAEKAAANPTPAPVVAAAPKVAKVKAPPKQKKAAAKVQKAPATPATEVVETSAQPAPTAVKAPRATVLDPTKLSKGDLAVFVTCSQAPKKLTVQELATAHGISETDAAASITLLTTAGWLASNGKPSKAASKVDLKGLVPTAAEAIVAPTAEVAPTAQA